MYFRRKDLKCEVLLNNEEHKTSKKCKMHTQNSDNNEENVNNVSFNLNSLDANKVFKNAKIILNILIKEVISDLKNNS